jgi:hypothetical protein
MPYLSPQTLTQDERNNSLSPQSPISRGFGHRPGPPAA